MMGLLWFGPEYRQTLIQTFFERNVNSHHYIDEIIIPYVVPHQEFIGDNFLLMQDNARAHVAGIVTDFLNDTNICYVPRRNDAARYR